MALVLEIIVPIRTDGTQSASMPRPRNFLINKLTNLKWKILIYFVLKRSSRKKVSFIVAVCSGLV